MTLFNVKRLFTNVSREDTIDIVLNKIDGKKKIETNIAQNIMKDHLYLCKYGKIYIQIDGVAMRSPLGPLLVKIFLISLKEAILPSLKKHVAHWKRYVDNTHAYIDPSKIGFVLVKLNSHYSNIQFTYKIEENQKIKFLDHMYRK